MCLAQGPQRSDTREARTRSLESSTLALSHCAPFNTKMMTGTAMVLSNPTQLVIDVAFGNFCRLSCCFTDCILQSSLTCNYNGFMDLENNLKFVLFYFHIK